MRSQDRDWNCGIFCLAFVLELFGMKPDIRTLERTAGVTAADGTPHGVFEGVLVRYGIKWISKRGTSLAVLAKNLPAIVNYQAYRDGHYAVFLTCRRGVFSVYDPAVGQIVLLSADRFLPRWFSRRYGKRWFIHPLSEALP